MGFDLSSAQTRTRHDDAGRVRVYVRLVDKHAKIVKGNVSRTFTIHTATVTQVARLIEKALANAQR